MTSKLWYRARGTYLGREPCFPGAKGTVKNKRAASKAWTRVTWQWGHEPELARPSAFPRQSLDPSNVPRTVEGHTPGYTPESPATPEFVTFVLLLFGQCRKLLSGAEYDSPLARARTPECVREVGIPHMHQLAPALPTHPALGPTRGSHLVLLQEPTSQTDGSVCCLIGFSA